MGRGALARGATQVERISSRARNPNLFGYRCNGRIPVNLESLYP